MSNQNNEFDVKAYRRDLVASLRDNVMEIIRQEARNHGEEHAQLLAMGFVKNLLAQLIYESIRRPAVPDGMSKEEASVKCYQGMKTDIQTAVADAFTGAMVHHNPKADVDYYCDVNLVPEVKHRKVM